MADILGVVKSQLVITFKTDGGTTHTVSFPNPKSNLTEAQIKEVADHIVANDYLRTGKDEALVGIVKAKVVSSDTDKFDLA